jgi:hypothetical protein
LSNKERDSLPAINAGTCDVYIYRCENCDIFSSESKSCDIREIGDMFRIYYPLGTYFYCKGCVQVSAAINTRHGRAMTLVVHDLENMCTRMVL